jgi:type I restriction enzyme M protein
MFENAFKYVDDILRKDAGCSTALDYVEQSSWILFLKYLDDFENDRSAAAALTGAKYRPIIESKYQWKTWAAPKDSSGKLDHNLAMTGDDLLDFINEDLWKYLAAFKKSAVDPDTLEYKIGEIYSEIKNKLQSGYNIREIIDQFDQLRFGSAAEKHEMSVLYEEKIKGMGNAGRNGGEYYTPRPLIRAMVKIMDPKVGERVYDPAVGSAGFLVEAYEHMREQKNLSTEQLEFLQKNTFVGKEVKSLAYIIGTMNMILHGIEAPRIIHTNSLTENVMDIQEKDRFDVILANPPFGGSERPEVQQNFPIRSGETAYLFLQHFIRSLKTGGRAAIVIKNTFLSNGDAAALRKELLETCNLHTVLDCPAGTFTGTGVKTVVLFFTKGEETKNVWLYQLNVGRNMGKTNPLNDKDLAEFVSLSKKRSDSENSWSIKIADINQATLDLSARNPNRVEEIDDRTPSQILEEIERLDKESAELLAKIRSLL